MSTSRPLHFALTFLCLAILLGFVTNAHAQNNELIRRVPFSTNGEQANGPSDEAAISADGRYVAFKSAASNLVEGDTNDTEDVFLLDTTTGYLSRISVNASGEQGNSNSYFPSISADGRFIAFGSAASNLVPLDSNQNPDIYVYDRQTQKLKVVSVSSEGVLGNDFSTHPTISSNGRFVLFQSYADNLVPGDTNGFGDEFVYDLQTGQTTRESLTSSGAQSGGTSAFTPYFKSSISSDGRYVVFLSFDDIVPDDHNNRVDVFVRDRLTGDVQRVSIGSNGEEGDEDSYYPTISDDGRFVAFYSRSTTLVPQETNATDNVYVYDRQTSKLALISQNAQGQAGNSFSLYPRISADGNTVVFESNADNLVAGDTNGKIDVFYKNLSSNDIRRITNLDVQGNGDSFLSGISPAADYITFYTRGNSLVGGDTNAQTDTFIYHPALSVDIQTTPQFLLYKPGQTVTFSLTVTNNGNIPDAFRILFSGDLTGTPSETATPELNPGETFSRTIAIIVPEDEPLFTGLMHIDAVSIYDPNVKDTAAISINPKQIFLPMIVH